MDRPIPPEAAALIRQARAALGLSQAQFGDRLGRSQGVVSRYESGQVAPPADVIMHCMHVLEPRARDQVLGDSGTQRGLGAVYDALAELTQAIQSLSPGRNRSHQTT